MKGVRLRLQARFARGHCYAGRATAANPERVNHRGTALRS